MKTMKSLHGVFNTFLAVLLAQAVILLACGIRVLMLQADPADAALGYLAITMSALTMLPLMKIVGAMNRTDSSMAGFLRGSEVGLQCGEAMNDMDKSMEFMKVGEFHIAAGMMDAAGSRISIAAKELRRLGNEFDGDDIPF